MTRRGGPSHSRLASNSSTVARRSSLRRTPSVLCSPEEDLQDPCGLSYEDLWDMWDGGRGLEQAVELVRLLAHGPTRAGARWEDVCRLLQENDLIEDNRCDPPAPVRQRLAMIATTISATSGVAGEPYRALNANGRYFYKRARKVDARSGNPRQCFANALASELDLWVGYAMTTKDMIPIAHCWNVFGKLQVIDYTPAWCACDAYYWGIPVPRDVATAVGAAATHGDEFMDCWRSAVSNSEEKIAFEWRMKLGWVPAGSELPYVSRGP